MGSKKRRYDTTLSGPAIDTELFDEVFDRIAGRQSKDSGTHDQQATGASRSTVAPPSSQPLPLTTEVTKSTHVRQTTVVPEAIVIQVQPREGHTALPNVILDSLLPVLEPLVGLVYLRLYRLSHGFRSDTCLVGYPKLAKSLHMSQRSVVRAIEKLERFGLIKREGSNFGKGPKGNTYRVMLPSTIASESVVAGKTAVVSESAHATVTGNKSVFLKENTPTQQPGRVSGSQFSLKECRRFADHLHKTGQGITNPGGYATTIYRTGEADTLIEAFLNPKPVQQIDISKCPDCKGTGWKIIEGKGAQKCKHAQLEKE